MAVVLAVPLAELAVALLATAIGSVAILATVEEIMSNPSLPAKARTWIAGHITEFKEHLKRKEDREPTPATAPMLFEWKMVEGRKAAVSRLNGEIWELDLMHADHFEVYSSVRHFKNGNRNRAVWLDGRYKPLR